VFPPRHVRISNNAFSHINYQAIYAGSTSTSFATDINSVNNYFNDVGNINQGDSPNFQVTEVIKFGSYGNNSQGDTFERLEKMINISTKNDYILSSSTQGSNPITQAKPIVSGPAVITVKSPQVSTFSSGIGRGNPIFGFPLSDFTFNSLASGQVITVNYTVVQQATNLVRRGTLEIVVRGINSSVDSTITDKYTYTGIETAPIFFTTEAIPSPANILVVYLNTAGSAGTIFYTFTVRQ
jgi:hypothetical protein